MGHRILAGTDRKRRIGIVVAGFVFVGACSSGSTGETGGNDATSPTATAATATAPETTDRVEPAPPATTDDSIAPDGSGDQPPTLAELETLAFDGEIPEIDVALTEFAVVTGVEIEGALPVTLDEFVPDELTSVVMRLETLDDQLTDRQRQQIDDYLDEIRSSARTVIASTDGPDESVGATFGAEPVDDSPISAFAGARNRPAALTDDQLIGMVASAQEFILGQLGGTVPNWQFSLIAENDRVGRQRSWNGWATSREEAGTRSCEVFIVDFADRPLERTRATVVHEYFHCWHSANVPGSIDVFRRSPRFVVEGLAEWAESEGSTAADGSTWADRFLDVPIGKLYTDSYAAIGFYWQVNHLDGGPDALWGRIPNIIANADAASAFRAATAGLTPPQLAQLGSSGIRKADWGGTWTFNHPRLGDGARPVQERAVRATAYEFASAGQQVAIQFDFTTDDDEPKVIVLRNEGLSISGWYGSPNSIFLTSAASTWCLNPECVCEDGASVPDIRPVPGNDPRIIVALTGGATEPASVKADIMALDDACEDGPDDTDPELTGVWIADPEAVVEAFGRAYEQIGISVTGASGELSLTLFDDSRAELRYDEVRLGLSDPFIDEVILNGAGKLEWRVEGAQLIFSELADFSVSIVTPAIGNDPTTITDEDLPPLDGPAETTMDYVREGSSLSMSNVLGSLTTLQDGTAGVLVFPSAWTRAGDAP